MIERPYYIDRLWRQRGVGLVKVLTGMRRSGKSGILRLLEQRLLKEGVRPDSLLFINLELAQNAHLREPDALLAHTSKRRCIRANRRGTGGTRYRQRGSVPS